MYNLSYNSAEKGGRAVANNLSKAGPAPQSKWQGIANNSKQVRQLQAYQTMSAAEPIRESANKTGMPDQLKAGIEGISGYTMDDVKVHYNSQKPAQLRALAYAQGREIHLGPGQEKHLPHEAWHIVQQKQGRVQPTAQMNKGVGINDDPGLEQEATAMGQMAMRMGSSGRAVANVPASPREEVVSGQGTAQLMPIILIYRNGYLARVESKNLTRRKLRRMLSDDRLAQSSTDEIREALAADETIEGEALPKRKVRPKIEKELSIVKESNEEEEEIGIAEKSKSGEVIPMEESGGGPLTLAPSASSKSVIGKSSEKETGVEEDPILILSRNDKAGIYDLAMELLKTRPPEEFVYVSLGNSPAPIMQMVRQITKGKVVILPLPMSDVSVGGAEKIRTDETARNHLFKYLNQYINPSLLQGKTKVVVVDIAAGGKALRVGCYFLQAYYREVGHKVDVHMQALNETVLRSPEELEGEPEKVISRDIPVLPPVSKEQQDTQSKLVAKAYNKRYSLKEWEPASLPDILGGTLKAGVRDERSSAYTSSQIASAYTTIKDDSTRQAPVSRELREISPSDIDVGLTITKTSGELMKFHAITLPPDVKAEDVIEAKGTKWKVDAIELPAGVTSRLFIKMQTKYTLTRLE